MKQTARVYMLARHSATRKRLSTFLDLSRFIELQQQLVAQGESSEEASEHALRALRKGGAQLRSRNKEKDDVDMNDSMRSLRSLLNQLSHKND